MRIDFTSALNLDLVTSSGNNLTYGVSTSIKKSQQNKNYYWKL